ncbi:MAG: ABC transporter permease, partial [Terriglobales bacterium]
MNITEAIKIAFLSLWANKLRSALTLLGVVIGVAAVIAVVTFVNGINGYVATKIFNLGADVFIVFKNSPAITNVDKYLDAEKRKNLTMEDYAAVLEACKHCEWVGASINNASGHVKYGEQSISDTNVRGVTPSMVPILDIDLTAGRMINDTDLRNNSAVVVVGPDITENLMPGTDPIDKEIRIDSWVYRVIGVGKRKGKTLGQTLDNYALMPITSYQKQNGSHESIRISGKAASSGAGFDEAMDEARAVLRARRHVHPGDDDSFDIETNDSLLSIWSNFSGTFFYAMIGIAAISLVVGGIVIMNIMLVSV